MSNDLLLRVLEAHGGRENWEAVTGLTARLSYGGPFWEFRTSEGDVVDDRVEPRASFPTGFDDFETKWDAVQVAFFTSAATWNSLTEPFMLTYPGVAPGEVEPWEEHGVTWRRLAVTFPAGIANHNPDQIFYFDDDFMLRRMDYSPHVTGSPRIARVPHPPAGASVRRGRQRRPELRPDHARRRRRDGRAGGDDRRRAGDRRRLQRSLEMSSSRAPGRGQGLPRARPIRSGERLSPHQPDDLRRSS
jgi:hypothetical protein